MKKTGLFKIIMFMLLCLVVITWLVPAGYFNAGELADLGKYSVGFFDFFQLLFGTFEFQYFIQIAALILATGALYGVLGKTGKYRAWLERIANSLKGKELLFLAVLTFVIVGLTSVFNYSLILFIFMPFVISIILLLGYDKVTACVATFGSMLIGTIGSTTSYTMVGIVNERLGGDFTTAIAYKLIMLVLSYAVLVFYLYKAKRTKVTDEKIDDDMFIGEKKSNKYSVIPLMVIFGLMFVLLILACTNWETTFGIKAFAEFNESIAKVTINDFSILSAIIGTVSAFGEWYYAEMSIVCLLAAILIGMIYRIKFGEIFNAMVDGAKKILGPAVLVMFSYSVVYFAGNTMFYPTIANFILNATENFNIFFSSITMFLGSLLHSDMLYVANYVIPQIAAEGASVQVTSLLIQGIFGLTMFVAPTSATLVLGLSYLGIPYKEWLAKTWKLVLALLVIVLATIILAMVI